MFKLSPEVKEIGLSSRKFVFQNLGHFKAIFLPLVPVLVMCDLLELYFEYLEQDDFFISLPILLLEIYIFAILAISWHKLVILGEDSDFKTSFWRVVGHEFLFFRTWLFVGVVVPIILFVLLIALPVMLIPSLSSFLEDLSLLAVLALYILLALYSYALLSIVLYFPAAAVGAPITLRKAFMEGGKLTHQIFFSTIYATWKIFLAWLLYSFVVIGAISGMMMLWLDAQMMDIDSMMAGLLSDDEVMPVEKTEPLLSPLYDLLETIPDEDMFYWYQVGMRISEIPVDYIFTPLVTILCVSVVSNFYLLNRSRL